MKRLHNDSGLRNPPHDLINWRSRSQRRECFRRQLKISGRHKISWRQNKGKIIHKNWFRTWVKNWLTDGSLGRSTIPRNAASLFSYYRLFGMQKPLASERTNGRTDGVRVRGLDRERFSGVPTYSLSLPPVLLLPPLRPEPVDLVSVWPDWAIFEKFWRHFVLQNQPQKLGNFLCYLKNFSLYIQTALVPFLGNLGENWAYF